MNNLVIIDKLSSIKDTELVSFHMPGHKLGKIYEDLGYTDIVKSLYKMDTTEIPETDNLHSPEGIIKESQERAAKLFRSDKTYYLVNGSTSGIQAAILSVCKPNDKIIVNRDCHQSVINACILGDIDPVYIKPNVNDEFSIINSGKLDDIKNTIDENSDAKALLITYPTYYGMVNDLEDVCTYAHNKGLIVIVDEAHGSHLGLSKVLPKPAITQGADIVIQSTHKTLPAFTQSSMVHIKGNKFNINSLENMLRMIESSSPSYILMSSLELAVDIYESKGKELMDKLLKRIEELNKSISNKEYISTHVGDDKTKVFISLKDKGITGYKLEEILRYDYNIQVELSNHYGVLLICTIANNENDFKNLEKALIDINDNYSSKDTVERLNIELIIPTKKISPRDAFYKDKKSVKIYESIGKIAGEYVIPYPPGISILSPGEVITKEVIDYIVFCSKEGMNISSMKDSTLETIQIVEE